MSRPAHRHSVGSTGSPVIVAGLGLVIIATLAAERAAKRFAVQQGFPLARAVSTRQPFSATWEDTQCGVWGPRRGKTSARIPTLLSASGAAFATSNKPGPSPL